MTSSAPAPVKFLLVDDLEDNLLVLEKVLARPDLVILKAHSGREALELLLEHEVALALIDVQMPEMDGFELAGLMRGVERTRHIPIIFVTAGLRRDWVFQGYDAGAVDFLMKPVDARILRHKAEVFYQLYTQRVELARKVKRLHDAEEFRARLIESSQDAILVIDGERRVVSADGKGADLAADLPPGTQGLGDFGELWHESARSEARSAFERAFSGESLRIVIQGRPRAGMPRYWDVALTPVRSAQGDVMRLLAIARDVTRERLATEDRERLTKKLEETLRFHETFVATVGHDLRNPLNAIMVASQILLNHLEDPEMRRAVTRLRSSGARMTRMLEDLSDLARLRLGSGVVLEREAQDLSALVQRLVSEHSLSTPGRRIELDVDGDPLGHWDSACLERVVSNLLGNAVAHGDPTTGIRVRLDGRSDESVVLSVENGGEIPAELLPRIFEPFRSGQNGGKSGGLGLGLYIARRLVEAHGGDIRAQSDATGTKLSVSLPRA